MVNVVIATVIKFMFIELLLFTQESSGKPRRRPSRKIVFDENDESTFEVTLITTFARCKGRCNRNKRCFGVNFHTQQKTCHLIFVYEIGPEVTYRATLEKKSRFVCWEKDPSKRQALRSTTVTPTTTTETTTSTLQAAPTAPNSTAPSMYDYDVTPPDTTRISKTNTVSSNFGATTRGNVETTPRNQQGSSTTLDDEPVTKGTSSSPERKTTNGDSENNPNVSGTTSTTQFVTTSISGQRASSLPEGTTAYNVNPEVHPTTTATTTGGVTTQTTSLISGSHGTTSSPNPCDDDPFHEDCFILCMPPQKLGSIPHLGNMYTVGSKHAYVCYNQTAQKWYSQVITCTNRETWDNMDTVCSYHYPIKVKRKQMMYKKPHEQRRHEPLHDKTKKVDFLPAWIQTRLIVKVPATKDQASKKCILEHASLLKVNNGKVTRALGANFQSSKGDYWTDVTRRHIGRWLTSDGVRVKTNSNVFETSSGVWRWNWWHRLPCAYLKPIFRLIPSACDVARHFICEMTM